MRIRKYSPLRTKYKSSFYYGGKPQRKFKVRKGGKLLGSGTVKGRRKR